MQTSSLIMGNSVELRIPKLFFDHIDMKKGDILTIGIKNNEIILKKKPNFQSMLKNAVKKHTCLMEGVNNSSLQRIMLKA